MPAFDTAPSPRRADTPPAPRTPLAFNAICLALGAWAITCALPASAQLAPSGYTGALNTPTADVLPMGNAEIALTNNNPETRRQNPGLGGFGSFNLGFGVLPGLEMVGRLAFEGDLQCNQYVGGCQSSMRDLSASAKYQLPLNLPFNTRLAIGVTDFGGAATKFRQSYGVATTRVGDIDFSLGYSKPVSTTALMRGAFGSAVAHVTDSIQLAVEHDSLQTRAGARYQVKLSAQTSLKLAASTRLNSQPNTLNAQKIQLGVALQWALETPGNRQAIQSQNAQADTYGRPALPFLKAEANSAAPALEAPPAPAAPTQPPRLPSPPLPLPQSAAEALARAVTVAGFTNVRVGIRPTLDSANASSTDTANWWVMAEPLSWRKSRQEALGKALAAWLAQPGHAGDSLTLALTYLQQPTAAVFAQRRDCLEAFKSGLGSCNAGLALQLLADTRLPERDQVRWLVDGAHTDLLHPRLEFGPALRYTAGTEYGLFDYSLGLDTGWEIPLAKGLAWQGYLTTPVSGSADFEPGRIYGGSRVTQVVQTSMLTYVKQPIQRLWVQGTTGRLTPTHKGSQIDISWFNEDGRWRLSGLVGRYRPSGEDYVLKPQLAQVRYSVIPGRWFVEATWGQFLMHDQGIKLASNHWFGDYRVSLFVRQSQSPGGYRMPQTRFAGINVIIPFGPSASAQLGPVNVRTKDQWSLGLETKVGAKDNYITGGYGLMPQLRHGLTDVNDLDRGGAADMWAQRDRIRAAMNQ
jgi:hypothetical protein